MSINYFFSLSQKCLTFNPAKRISAYGALSHPYFHDLERRKENLDSHLPPSHNSSEMNIAWARAAAWSGSPESTFGAWGVPLRKPRRAGEDRRLGPCQPLFWWALLLRGNRSVYCSKPMQKWLQLYVHSLCVCLFVCLFVWKTWKNSRREAADQSCCHFIFLTLNAASVKWAIQAQWLVMDLPAAAGPDLVLLNERNEWVCVCVCDFLIS